MVPSLGIAAGARRLTRSTYPIHLALAVAVAAFVVGVRWGTFAAGGSDSSCYLNQARLFAHRTTHIDEPLAARAPWPRAEWTFTPAGHIPSPIRKTSIVPMCPPGLPLLMAAASVVPSGQVLVVPLCGALAVWLTFVLGRRIAGAVAGAASAVLLACSPIFLFQVVQPMTDVPAMMWWLLAIVLAVGDRPLRSFLAGAAASISVLTRPNLLPLAVIIAVYITIRRRWSAKALAERAARSPKGFALHLLFFMAGLAPGVLLLALLQARMYGSPLASGYGAVGELFRTANVAPNAMRYGRWLVAAHTPILSLALLSPWLLRPRAEAWLCLAVAATTIAAYLPYQVFDDWWYIRFLLPALPLLIVLTIGTIAQLAARAAPRHADVVVAVVTIGLAIFWVRTARDRYAFDLQRFERHFIEAGTYAASKLPANGAVLTVRHSGSVHYYAQRSIVSWDTLEPQSLDDTLRFLRAQGRTPILLLDVGEEPEFRARFGSSSGIGQLDWPPIARIGRTVRAYDPADRQRYLAGATIQTIDWPPRSR